MISGRELSTGERWTRGLLAPLDIIPAGSAAKKFVTAGRLGNDLATTGLKTANASTNIGETIKTAIHAGKSRLESFIDIATNCVKALGKTIIDDHIEFGKIILNGIYKTTDQIKTTIENFTNTLNNLHVATVGGDTRYLKESNIQQIKKDIDTSFNGNISGKGTENNISKLTDADGTIVSNVTKGAGNVNRLIPGTPGVVTGGNSNKLGKNMLKVMRLKRSTKWRGYQAQHIIPSEMANHPVIQKIGMNLDDATNGIFLRVPGNDISPMSRHQGYHSVYNEVVKRALDRMDINQNVNNLEKQVYKLQSNLRKLQEQGLPLYPNQGATVELWERKLKQLKNFLY